MATKMPKALVARIVITAAIIVAVAVISYVMLSPLLTNPPRKPILLDEMTMLTEDNYERNYNLTLKKGDEIYIQVSGFGQPLDFRITAENRFETLLEETDITSFGGPWAVPRDGTYFFYVGAQIGDVKVRITVSRL
jgi:hypothetical protein